MTLRVAPYEGAATTWDEFVRHQRGWSHFHLYGWRRVIERVFGHECVYLAAFDEQNKLAGVLPLVRVRSVLFGHYLVSMPFLNYGGPLGSDDAVRALVAGAVTAARSSGVKLLELRSREELRIDLPVSHRKITVLLDLPRDPATLMKSFEAKLRSQVRRPIKDGVSLRFGTDQIPAFYEVFSRHMRDLGTPTQPRRLFEAIAEEFGDSVWFVCAYHQERPIAVGCGFRWGDEFEITWASALIEHKKLSANMLVYWGLMERAIAEGVSVFNFGRCTPGGGTHRFKQQWGGRDVPLWWYDWSPHGAVTTPSPDAGAFSWGPRLWKQLPASIATRIGPRIVRYIP